MIEIMLVLAIAFIPGMTFDVVTVLYQLFFTYHGIKFADIVAVLMCLPRDHERPAQYKLQLLENIERHSAESGDCI